MRLIDLLGLGAVSVQAISEGWARRARSSGAVVGVSDAGPVAVDLKADGPHGLIVGTTRSGKTEFIKTLIVSLAVANTPENLHVLIIDFKEGNDYLVARDLPHTVDLVRTPTSTTSSAHCFIDAELGRRRSVSRRAAPNIEAYWSVRDQNPSIGPPSATFS